MSNLRHSLSKQRPRVVITTLGREAQERTTQSVNVSSSGPFPFLPGSIMLMAYEIESIVKLR